MSLVQLEQVLLWLTLVAALGIVSIIAFYFWYSRKNRIIIWRIRPLSYDTLFKSKLTFTDKQRAMNVFFGNIIRTGLGHCHNSWRRYRYSA